ncbi:hypothetical protein GGS20DRAFT_574917 [Poronia punctata]|nr:hypothetical protein GGS20DRAFT_574917 [Poronia punctata]
MSAPGITYSGVLAKEGDNSRNNNDERTGVFQGLKIWVSHKVPDRKTCTDTIVTNGGLITPRDKDADLIICDSKRDHIPGSYSHQLIDNAVERGSLDEKEDYLCGALLPPSSRTYRNKFTVEEDRALSEFVNEKAFLGEATSGNGVYQEFAKTHPTHTWQSWRNRWIKRLKDNPPPPVFRPRKRLSLASRQVAAQNNSADSAPVATPEPQFTGVDDERLVVAIRHAIESHEPWDSTVIYRSLANKFPEHTWQTWRERALEHVAKQHKDDIAQWEAQAGSQSGDAKLLSSPRNTRQGQGHEVADRVHAQSPPINTHQDHDNSREPVESSQVDLHVGGIDEDEDDDMESVGQQEPPISREKRQATIAASPSKPTESAMKEQFYRDYNTFLDSIGTNTRSIPSVGGKAIALWDLWKSVTSKKMDPDELDWQQVAEDLGFDWIAQDTVPVQLRQCYETHLASFAEFMMDFEEASGEESAEEDGNIDHETPLPSSPPVRPSLKRSLEAADALSSEQQQPPRKRTKLNEVRSSPERNNRIVRLQHSATPIASSPHAHSSAWGRPTPTSRIEEEELPAGRPAVEPETQDFAFGPETQAQEQQQQPEYETDDSQRPMTPSQQLIERIQEDNNPSPQSKPKPKPKPKRRTLPSSFTNKSSPAPPPPPQQQQQQQQQPSSDPFFESPPPVAPAKETPDAIIDHFISLGYSPETVVRSLKATSWIIGNAGQVMEMLKQGEPLPQRTSGVWTPRDDDALMLVFSSSSSSSSAGTEEEKKKRREKEMRRLKRKHGDEQIRLRKRYLLE